MNRVPTCAVLTLLIAPVAIADELDQIIADWDSRQSQISSLSMSVRGEGLIPRQSMIIDPIMTERPDEIDPDAFPKEDVTFDVECDYLCDFALNRARKRVSHLVLREKTLTLVRSDRLHAFDGKTFARYRPRSANSWANPTGVELHLRNAENPGNAERLFFAVRDFPVLFAAGVVPGASKDRWPTPKNFRLPNTKSRFTVNGNGDIGGREHVVVRTNEPNSNEPGTYFEYWVDVQRRSAIGRAVWMIDHEPRYQVDVSHEQTEHGWMPTAWRYQSIKDNQLRRDYSLRAKIDAVNESYQISEFQIAVEDGMAVMNHATGDKDVLRTSRKVDDRTALVERSSGSLIAVISGLGLVVIVVLAASARHFLPGR